MDQNINASKGLNKGQIFKGALIFGIIGFVVWIYKQYNPLESGFFPQCPFKQLTGWDCPLCGSQRAIHFLLNGSFDKAFLANPLLLAGLPYVVIGTVLNFADNSNSQVLKWRNRLFGMSTIKVILGIVLVFWIGRNII